MQRQWTTRWMIAAAMIAAVGLPVSVYGQEGAPAPAVQPPAEPPAAEPSAEPPAAEPSADQDKQAAAAPAPTDEAQAKTDEKASADVGSTEPASAPTEPAQPAPMPRIAFNFKNTPYDMVLDFFARESGLPVIYEAPAPSGTLTFISAESYSFRDALSILNLNLKLHNVRLEREANFLYLKTIQSAILDAQPGMDEGVRPEEFRTVTIPLNTAKASTLAEQIKPLLSPEGKVVALDVQNSLMVVDTAAHIERLEKLVHEIDVMGDVDREFRVFALSYAEPEAVVNALKGLVGERVKQIIIDKNGKQRVVEEVNVAGLNIQPDKRTRSVIVVGAQSRIDTVAELIKLLDAPEGGGVGGQRQMMTFALEQVTSADAAKQLNSLFQSVDKRSKPTILPLTQLNKIMIVGSSPLLAQAMALIGELDPTTLDGETGRAGPEREARTIVLEHVTPSAVESIVHRLLTPRQVGVLKFAPTPNQTGLLVAGPSRDVEAFERLVRGLDVAKDVDKEVRLVKIADGDPEAVLKRAGMLYEETGQAKEYPVTTSLDKASRTVTLIGARDALGRYEQVLRSVQSNMPAALDTRTYELTHVKPSKLGVQLGRLARPLLMPTDGSTYHAPSFEPLDELDTLIVRAEAGQFAVIEQLLSRLDVEEPVREDFRVVKLNVPDPEVVIARAHTLYEQRTVGLEPEEAGPVTTEYDATTGNLLISARQAGMRIFTDVLTQAQRLIPPARHTKILDIQNVEASTIIGPLTEFLASADSIDPARAVPVPTIKVIDRTNSLLVTAEDAQQRLIQDYVRRLDQIEPSDMPPLKLLQLKTADVNSIASMLMQQYQRRPQSERLAKPVEIRADANTNTLIVAAHEDVFPQIKEFVETINKEGEDKAERQTVLFQLKVAKAQDVATAMDKLYPQPPIPRDRYGRPQPWLQKDKEVTVSAEPNSNSLIIDAPKERIASLEELAQKLDTVELPPMAELRTYHVVDADLAQLTRTLQSLQRQGNLSGPAQPGKQAVKVVIDQEPRSSTLIVAGDAVTFERVDELLAKFSEAPVEKSLRVIPISRMNASELRARAMELYTAQISQLPGVNPIEVVVDENTNALMVVADSDEMRRFTSIVTELQRQAPPVRTTKIVELEHKDAADVIGPLQEFLASADSIDPLRKVPDATISVAEATNSLVVTAEPAQHELIRDYVRRLDRLDVDMPPLKLLQLKTADAVGIASMLTQQYSSRSSAERSAKPVQIKADANTNTLIVSAHEDVFPAIKAFVDDLNVEQDKAERETILFQLKVARAQDVATAMDKLYPVPPIPRDRYGRAQPWLQEKKEVTVSAEPNSNSLIIDAPTERIASLTELAAKLDTVEVPPVAQLRTYHIVNADLSAVKRTLDGMARQGIMSTPPEPGEQPVKVTIETEPISSTLIVAGDETTFARVEEMLEKISAVPVEKGLRIVPVANVDAESVRERALAIYNAQIEQIPDANPVDVTINQGTNSLEVVADAEAMDRFMKIIDELQSQAGPAREVRMIELRFAKVDEVISFLEEMVSASEALKIQGGPDPVFEPIQTTNAIMVAAQPSQFTIIEQLIKSLDNQQTADRPPLRILRVRTTDAASIATMLQESYDRRPVDERAKKPVQIEADAATNTLIVSAHEDVLPEIEAIVTELNETQALDAEGRQIGIFPLKYARADELARTIDEMYPEPPMPIDPRTRRPRPDLRQPKEVFVRADRQTNSLIVEAPVQRLAGFEQLVKSLDQQNPAADVEVRTYRVAHAELDSVTRTLQELADRGALGAIGHTPVTVNAESLTRTLVVSGPSEIFDEVETVLAELDAKPDLPPTSLRMYALAHQRAERLQPLLEQILTTRLREQEYKDGRIVADVVSLLDVAADRASNMLIVTAPEDIQQIAEQLVKSLDTEAAAAGRSMTRVIPLTYADAAQTAKDLTKTMPSIELPTGGTVSIVAIVGSNALLMTGLEPDLNKVEETVRQLDVKPFDPEKPDVQTFKLEHADAQQIAKTVERLLIEQQETDPRVLQLMMRYGRNRADLFKKPTIRVEAEDRTNSLIISGPTGTLDLAKTIIERLDQPADDPDRTAMTFTPAKGDPAALVSAVRKVVEATLPRGRTPLELVAEPSSGSIVVLGTPEQAAKAVQLLAEYDDRALSLPRVDFQVFDLTDADARAVASTVQSMISDRSRWPEDLRRAERAGLGVPQPTVNADPVGNRLLVSVPTQLMPLARQLIETLDQPKSQQAVDVRVFQLTKGDAAGVATAVRSALAAAAEPGEPAPTVTAEPGSNTIVISGSSSRLEQAAELVASLDQQIEPEGMAVRTVFLKHARAEAVAPVVEQVLRKESFMNLLPSWAISDYVRRTGATPDPGVRVVPERRLNAVVVSAPLPIMELAEQVVTQLDADPGAGPDGERIVRILSLANADASQVQANIEALFTEDEFTQSPPTIRVDSDSNSLIIRATQEQLTLIERVTNELDAKTLTSSRQLRLIHVDPSRASAAIMAQQLKNLLDKQGGVTVEIISADELLGGEAEEDSGKVGDAGEDARPFRTMLKPASVARRLEAAAPGGCGVGSVAGALHVPVGEVLGAVAFAAYDESASQPELPAGQPSAASFNPYKAYAKVHLDQLTRAWSAFMLTAHAAAQEQPEQEQPEQSQPEQSQPEQEQPAEPEAAVQPAQPTVKIAIDPATNSLLVIGSPRLTDRLAALAAEIEKQMPREPTTVHIVQLPDDVNPQAVQGVINQTVRAVGRTSPANPGGFTGSVSVAQDPSGSAVIVWANDTDFDAVRSLIASVAQLQTSVELTVKIYPLSNVTAARAVRAVNDLFSGSPRGRQARRTRERLNLTLKAPEGGDIEAVIDPTRFRVMSDPNGTSLIVFAPADALPVIDQFVAMIDQSTVTDRLSIRRYELENAQAQDLARTFGQLFDAQRQGPLAKEMTRARFIADTRTNALLVTASDAQHAEVEHLLKTADGEYTEDLDLAILPLQNAPPSVVQRVVEQVIIGRDPAKRETVRISAEDDSNLFVVQASAEDITRIKEIVAQVDVAGVGGLPVRAIKLERADADEVAQALSKFFQDRAKVSSRTGKRVVNRVAIAGDRRSASIIVAASDDDFAQIQSLIETFDSPAVQQELKFEIIPLKYAKVDEVVDTVQSITWELQWERVSARRGGQRPSEGTLLVEGNNRTNSIVVFGKPDMIETAIEVISKLDQPVSDVTKRVVRVVEIEKANLDAIANVVRQAMSEQNRQRWWMPDTEGVQVVVDKSARRLILIGEQIKVARAMEYVTELASTSREDSTIEAITLTNAAADRAARSLQQFFRDRARTAGLPENQVSIIGSRDGNVLIVSGSQEDLTMVHDLIAQMDQPEMGPDRQFELYLIKNRDVTETANLIRAQFPRTTRSDKQIIVTPQPSTDSILISMPNDMIGQVDQLVAMLDAAPTQKQAKIVTVTLESAQATDVVQSLTKALHSSIKVKLTPVPRNNSIMITGSDEAIALVMEQIKALDTAPVMNPLQYKRIKLENALAFDVYTILRSMAVSYRGGPNDPKPTVDYSSTDNTISISATSDQLDYLLGILTELDVSADGDRITEFVKLQFADAEQTSKALQVFYGRFAPEAHTPSSRAVTIVPDPTSNSLVISADEKEWEGIRALLVQLDTEEYDTTQQLVVIPLTHADAQSVARALNQGFQAALQQQLRQQQLERQMQRRNQPRGRNDFYYEPPVLVAAEDQPSVSAEPQTNSLIVFAGRKELSRIESIVKQLDVPDFMKYPDPVVIPLRSGRASQIAQSIRSLFSQRQTAPSSPKAVLVFGDDSSNTLIVRADESDLAQIKVLAESLQQESAVSLASVRVLPVRSMPAARLQGTIQNTFSVSASQRGEALVVQVDRDRNALVISSSQKMYDEIKDVVEELDRVTVDDGGSIGPVGVGQGVYIIDVQNHSPGEMRTLLEQLGVTRPQPADRPGVVSEPVTITTLTTRSALAVVAGARDGQTIKALVASLDSQPVTPDQHMAVVRLKLATASALAAVVERMLNPADQDSRTSPAQALAEQVRRLNLHRTGVAQEDLGLDLSVPIRLIADDFTNSIIVASTKANVASIAQVIETLDTLPIGDAVVVRIFPLDNASATRVRGVVEQLFAQGEALRRLPGTRRLGLPPTATGQALAGEITVAVDERTNALIVAGREEAVALVEVLIADLDGDDVAQWIEPVLIPLEHADAVTLAQKLNTVLVRGLRTMPDAIGLQRQIARLQMVRAGGDPTNPDDAIQSDLFSSLTGLVIEPEETLNALIVVGSRDNIAVIRELTGMLDVAAASASNTVRVYPLEYAAADRVASMVSDIFSQREQAGQITRPEDRVIVIADARTNALTVSTSPRSFEVVESLLETFDQAEARATVSLHVIPVAHGDVADLAPVIERLMNQRIASTRRAGGVDSPMDVFSVSALPAIDSLIVQCSDENLAIVQDLLADLEEGSAVVMGADQNEIVQLSSNTPAADAASHLRDLYVDKENARRGDGSVGVVPNERLNALILSGAGDDIAAMKQLIEDLEQTRPSITQQIRRIELTTANALEMVSLIQNVLAGPTLGPRRAGSPQATIVQFYREQVAAKLSEQGLASSEAEVDGAIRDHVTLTPDLRTNSVIIKAPPEIGALIADMVNDLDTTDAGERQYELFRLVNADARQMATILVDLFNLRQQGASYVLMPARQPDEQQQDTEQDVDTFGGITVTPVPDERQQLSITVDARTNSLLVGGTEEYLELVRNVVKELDKIEANEREQRVIELRYAKADDVQRVLQDYFRAEAERVMGVLGGERAGSIQRQLEREVTVIGDQKSNKIMFAASPRYIETVAQMIEELDAAPPQVMIQVLIAEVTVNEGDTWGIDMEFRGIGGDNFTLGSLAAGAGVATALGVPHLTVASSDIQLLIRSLREQGKLNVLSEPRLTVKNNETANMQVGEDIALINGVERFSDGSSVANVERRDVGIIMEVTPTISPDGFVHMLISPEISTVSAETDQLSPEVSAARISTRKLNTVVTVRDGQTIVIGGLFQTTQQDRKTHVPILSKIPVAGELFKSHDISEVKTELLVILTPRIIPGGLGGDDTNLENFTERNIDHLPTTLDLRGAIHNFNPDSKIKPPALIEPDADKPVRDVEQVPEDDSGSAGFPEEW